MSRFFSLIAVALLALFLWENPAFAELEKNERMRVSYKVAYRVGFLKLLDLARVTLSLRDDFYTAPDEEKPRAVLVVDLQIKPAEEKIKGKSRVYFDSSFKTVLDPNTFQILYYQKRIREELHLVLAKTKKDYLEEVFYELHRARVHRVDYLLNTVQDREVDLMALVNGEKSGGEVNYLTSIVGKALFQEGFFHGLKNRPTRMKAQVVTHTRVYQFDIRSRKSRVRSPLTGKVATIRLESDVVFRTRKNEVVPFTAWFTGSTDMPKSLQKKVAAAKIYAFPTALKLEFTVGSLRVLAEEFQAHVQATEP